MPDDMPLSALPISQYYAENVAALLIIGGALAAALVRWRRRKISVNASGAGRGAEGRLPGFAWGMAGLILVQTAAVVQTFLVLARGLGMLAGNGVPGGSAANDPAGATGAADAADAAGSDLQAVGAGIADFAHASAGYGAASSLYFAGMLAGTVGGIALACVAFLLLIRIAPVSVAIGFGVSAPLLSGWLETFAINSPTGLPGGLAAVAAWLPAIVIGVVLGLLGVRPRSRWWAWVGDVVLLWAYPTVFGAVFAALGPRVLRADVGARIDAALDSLSWVAWQPLGQVAVAAAIGLLIVVVRRTAEKLAE